MPSDVHINQVEMLTYYSQHLCEFKDGLQRAMSQMVSALEDARRQVQNKTYEIQRLQEVIARKRLAVENQFKRLDNMEFDEEDRALIEQDKQMIENEARRLNQVANQLQQSIKTITAKIEIYEEQSKCTSENTLRLSNQAQSGLNIHIVNIGTYIGGN